MPAGLAAAAGVSYDEYSNLSTELPVRATADSPLQLGDDAAATRWADGLQVDGADVLASYEHPHFGRWPAITTRAHGEGRITYVGTVPNGPLAVALFRWLAPSPWTDLPSSVTVTSATAADGRRLRFVHNWSWDSLSIDLPAALHDVLANTAVSDKVDLGPWDVRVLVEPAQEAEF
jgi:beta-galactosidase